jgi:hypothetical protein
MEQSTRLVEESGEHFSFFFKKKLLGWALVIFVQNFSNVVFFTVDC